MVSSRPFHCDRSNVGPWSVFGVSLVWYCQIGRIQLFGMRVVPGLSQLHGQRGGKKGSKEVRERGRNIRERE